MSADSASEVTLGLARRVACEAAELGIPTAVIGAMALAAHGFIRATDDVDLGVCTPFSPTLQGLRNRLRDLGLSVTLRSPDDDDPLDGVLVVQDGDALVEVVNLRGRLGRTAIDNAEDLGEGLRCVRVAELVALKLYAGGRSSNHDVHELLDANPGIDHEEVEHTCTSLGLASQWTALVEQRKSTL